MELDTVLVLGTSENFLKTGKPRPFTAAAVIGGGLSTSASGGPMGAAGSRSRRAVPSGGGARRRYRATALPGNSSKYSNY